MHHGDHPAPRPNPVASRAVYSRAARKKLVDSQAKLNGVTAAVKQAISTGRLQPSPQLQRSLQAVKVSIAAAETRLRLLQKSGEKDWDKRRVELESAWEDLAHAVRSLVARFADGSRQWEDMK